MNHRKPVVLLITVIGVIALTCFYVAALTKYNALGHYLLYFAKGLYVYVTVYVIILATATKAYGGYGIGAYRAPELAFSQVLAITFVNVVAYFQISLIAKQFLRTDYLIYTTLAQYVFIIFWTFVSDKIFYSIYKPGRMALIYSGSYPAALAAKVEMSAHRFRLTDILQEDEARDQLAKHCFDGYDGIMICGTGKDFAAYISQYCFVRNIRLYIVPEISDIVLHNTGLTGLSDTPLLICRNDTLTAGQEVLKRLFDIAGSTIILLIASPLLMVISIAIKLYDGGPVFYCQDRLTRNGRVFRLYKFRSMISDAEKDGKARLAQKDDERITPVGSIIRKSRLDEIPQFINVLAGQMSIVGPRPERPEIAAAYAARIPEFNCRLKMKAGITGYAQVYGKYNTTPKDKLMMDIIYINSYSILMDIQILFLTFKIIFMPEKTEGISDARPDRIIERE